MLYSLSKFIPVPMKSKYTAKDGSKQKTSWWQWRGHIFNHRVTILED